MKLYENYNLEDFLCDDDFIQWALMKEPLYGTVWEKIIQSYPEKRLYIEDARIIILGLKSQPSELTSEILQKNITNILGCIDESGLPKIIRIFRKIPVWYGAAAILIAFLGSLIFWQFLKNDLEKYSYEVLVEESNKPLIEISNGKENFYSVKLPDGSIVTLSPGSKISYDSHFTNSDSRNVFLKGEATFEVAKDKEHPFLVFYKGVKTQVVGTKFTISSNNNEVSVAVHEGKVKVSRMSEIDMGKLDNGNVMLLPNQKAVFEPENNLLKKAVVESPIVLGNEGDNEFKFDNTPITTVFDKLEHAYKIRIVYNAKIMANCQLTIPFKNEPFFTKLDIICQTINAKYETVNGEIIITGMGCN